jgi:hypothetical protein
MASRISFNKKKSLGKLTMKQPFENTRFLSKQARATLDLMRPFTLAAPLIVTSAIMTASLLFNYRYYGGSIPSNWWATVGQGSLTVAIVNAASNALNQATDIKSDKMH